MYISINVSGKTTRAGEHMFIPTQSLITIVTGVMESHLTRLRMLRG